MAMPTSSPKYLKDIKYICICTYIWKAKSIYSYIHIYKSSIYTYF